MIVIDMDMPTDCVDCPIECFPYGGEDTDYSTTKRPSFCCIKCDIEDIKAEIEEKISRNYGSLIECGMKMALETIDKHIKGVNEWDQ